MATCFQIVERGRYYSIQLSKLLPAQPTEDFLHLSKGWIASSKMVIVSCAGVEELPERWKEQFQLLGKELRTAKRKLSLVFCHAALLESIKKTIQKPEFFFAETIEEAMREEVPEGKKDQKGNYLKVFIASTQRTILLQGNLKCIQEKIHMIPKESETKLMGDLSGIVWVESDTYHYVVGVSFDLACYLKIISKMLDQEFEELTPEIMDGASELMNMIYGQAKVVLNDGTTKIKPSIPCLVQGKKIAPEITDSKLVRIRDLFAKGKMVVVPFKTEHGHLYVQVCFPEEYVDQIVRT